ncbi:hypothetical protein PanWU01x14_243220 [Parasponia andersonii]|uniref:Uncharacterized protein n=1 Tax=Parasponia andersonii TaxID=3476 RepID=A0A2P5BFJ8_PARAD|nr:hypothetical protein PanWU01x14_243220 [Parasponia andersonii]
MPQELPRGYPKRTLFRIQTHLMLPQNLKTFIHEPLVGCPRVLQAKWHMPVAVQTSLRDKSHVDLVFRVQGDLVVSGVGIQKAHSVKFCRRIYHLVDSWQEETILPAGLVQVGEVYANTIVAVFLFHHYRVGDPSRVYAFPDQTTLQQHFYLLVDRPVFLWCEPSGFLPD